MRGGDSEKAEAHLFDRDIRAAREAQLLLCFQLGQLCVHGLTILAHAHQVALQLRNAVKLVQLPQEQLLQQKSVQESEPGFMLHTRTEDLLQL